MGAVLGSAPCPVLLLGLDNGGKTTLLRQLAARHGRLPHADASTASADVAADTRVLPTLGHTSTVVRLPQGGPTLSLTEVGGRRVFRDFWRYHAQPAEGIVFVVDSNDPARLEEARRFMFEVATSWELLGVPVLVLANKQDLPFALPSWQVAASLQTELLERLGHPTHVHRTVGLTGDGLVTALHVLAKFIRQRRRGSLC